MKTKFKKGNKVQIMENDGCYEHYLNIGLTGTIKNNGYECECGDNIYIVAGIIDSTKDWQFVHEKDLKPIKS